jgi:hypothetical protein
MTTFDSMKRVLAVAMVALLAGVNVAWACPFCSAESQTLSEETQSADAVVLAKLIKQAEPTTESDDTFGGTGTDIGTATFEIVDVLVGNDLLAGVKEIQAVFFGESDHEQVFLISGIGTDRIDWTTPLPLSTAAVEYVRKLQDVPASGVERLAFFQEYLENDDPLLAQDAYDEFARAPYAEVQALKPRMHHDRLVKWISDPEISPSRRRLYLTMLGVCGTANDLPMLEALIASDFQAMKPHLEELVRSAVAMGGPLSLGVWIDLVDQDERRKKLGLDAMVACYLALGGPGGLELIDERFLKNPQTEFTYIYSTIMALRFHGEEPTSNVPRERLLTSMRLLLDNPEFADQVIPDLARWEDWSVLDRLVSMFKTSDKNGYVRAPVVTYLTVASDQPGDVGKRATNALAELEQLDPEGVKQARSLMAFGTLGRSRAATGTAASQPADSTATDAPTETAAEVSSDLAASPAEIQASEQADPESFEDPANFAQPDQAAPTTPVEEAATADQSVPPSAEKSTTATPVTIPSTEGASSAKATPGPANEELNTLLVVGVPLVSAVLLMGVYWAILRMGAV